MFKRRVSLTIIGLLGLALTACGSTDDNTLTLDNNNQAVAASPNPVTDNVVTVKPTSNAGAKAQMGFVAPDFTLQNLDDQAVNLGQFRGKPVILNFWATWCGPCKEELPLLTKTALANAGKFTVVGVDVGEDVALVKLKVREVGMQYPNLLDSNQHVSNVYRINAFPTSYFIDKEGVIRAIKLGALTADTLENSLSKILGS